MLVEKIFTPRMKRKDYVLISATVRKLQQYKYAGESNLSPLPLHVVPIVNAVAA